MTPERFRRLTEAYGAMPEHWPLANPLFVALDLARDPGRGRQILDGWQPPRPWRKIWESS